MKKAGLIAILSFIIAIFLFNSCKKEYSCEGCRDSSLPPVANAGRDTMISLPVDSILLDGSGSTDPDGSISSYQWREIMGPSTSNLRSPDAVQSIAATLKKGVYEFELKVTDNSGLSDLDTVKITINDMMQANRPPIANAGADQIITLPDNSVNLDGSKSSDPDNNIVNYQWVKISGPTSFTIANAAGVATQVTNLTEGIYEFELKVTDVAGLSDIDTIRIEVKTQSNEQNLIDAIFYWAEPTGTVNFIINNETSIWIEWSYGADYLKLVTIKLDTLSDFLAGVWCPNCLPDCYAPYYASIWGDKDIVTFNLPPGTYNWTAETTLNVFPLEPSNNPSVTPEFFYYFNTIHKTKGTLTVNPGDSCVIQKIVFQ